jgi:hypothetical protein
VRGDEGTHFLAAFQELKNATTNSPAFLETHWKDREDLQQICDRLNGYRRSFDFAEEWTSVAFTPHVPAAASKARREYDDHWRRLVARVADRELMALFDELFPDELFEYDDSVDTLGQEIEGWKYGARNDAGNITHAFDYLADLRANDDDNVFEFLDEVELSWNRLMTVVGFDIREAFWRRSAIPHILFPSHVSNHYGPDHDSIYRRLFEASRAFTFGAPLAALAMQRAVLEQLLKGHWGSAKGWVRDANLPSLTLDARAERLKRLGDKALHGDPEKLSVDELDRQIIRNFLLLRDLIETAPKAK